MIATILALLMLARLSVRVLTVSGHSMEPTLLAGSRVLALRRWPSRWLRPGQVVLLRGLRGTGTDRLIIKRVANGPGETVLIQANRRSYRSHDYMRLEPRQRPDHWLRLGQTEIFVLGDNLASTDSRDWGPVPVDAVAGLVLTWSAIHRVHRQITKLTISSADTSESAVPARGRRLL
jgi:signal peptidase I